MIRTPLSRARGLGSARSGVHHWWLQRTSAIALAPLGVWFTLSMASLWNADYLTIMQWLRDPVDACLLGLFLILGIWHGAMGMQVIIEDYVPKAGQKIIALVCLQLLTWLLIGATALALLIIMTGA